MPGLFKSIGNFFSGTPAIRENVSTLRPEQEGLYNNLVNAGQNRGSGGAFGQSADYYRDLLGDNSADYNAFSAPAMRQYREQIVPDISEQFAGMGSGGLSSSGFRNAQVQGGVDLAERLGALRANLRQSGAQGLQNIGNLGLGSFSQNMETQAGTQGALPFLGQVAGGAVGAMTGGPIGSSIGSNVGNSFGNWFSGGNNNYNTNSGNNIGANTGPYGSQGPKASPTGMGNGYNPGLQMPNFLQGNRGF